MEERFGSYHPDMEAMHRGFRIDPCFVCRMVKGDILFPENVIYEDERFLVFLDGYPRAYGYTLVAPKEHREQVTGDFTMEEYIALQRLVYRVNSHVHWHVVPLPPGVPYEEQQGAWTSWSRGVLEIPHQEMAALANRIGARLG
jgi:diadenosine tetraphosphate (Ap4A) HIT family hydrolase